MLSIKPTVIVFNSICTKSLSKSLGICDVIKQNESELTVIEFLDRANNSIQFPLYFIVLSITKLYLWNHTFNFDGVFSMIKP